MTTQPIEWNVRVEYTTSETYFPDDALEVHERLAHFHASTTWNHDGDPHGGSARLTVDADSIEDAISNAIDSVQEEVAEIAGLTAVITGVTAQTQDRFELRELTRQHWEPDW
ncbi:hypothetical protein [Brevibacterium litoralis]|uniref:hypothetical protein n=1 Tax=Brevibacterium litoralis TaxID=3138935 RepID=UPI0032F05429